MAMDLTGARYQQGRARKEATPDAVRATRNALIDQPLELVKVLGGATYALPSEAVNQIIKDAKEGKR